MVNSTDQTINHSATPVLTFDTEVFDTNSLHDTASNTSRLTATKTGLYFINAQIEFEKNEHFWRGAHIRLNGVMVASTTVFAADSWATAANLSTFLFLNEGDYIELYAHQNSGSSLKMLKENTYFKMVLLSEGVIQ